MEKYDERICLCALNRIFGYTPAKAIALLENLGPAGRIFEEGGERLHRELPYFKGLEQICDMAYEKAEKELEEIEDEGCRFIGYTDSIYPALLKQCQDAPVGLYVRGHPDFAETFGERLFVAVVGTRDISDYGKEWCGRIVKALAGGGGKVTIVSGLAYGTDITAHRTALGNGAGTIGVMATGIDAVYPWRHKADADLMASSPGCALVTDYPPGTAPIAANFLRRNRIIAGMSEAVVLVESKAKGGGMMTARLAFSYDRDVYALPGRADDERSAGCNILIREKLAEPVISVDDFAAALGLKVRKRGSDETDTLKRKYSGMLGEERTDKMAELLRTIRSNRGIDIESLALSTGLGYRETTELASMLECEGFISIDLARRCSINLK